MKKLTALLTAFLLIWLPAFSAVAAETEADEGTRTEEVTAENVSYIELLGLDESGMTVRAAVERLLALLHGSAAEAVDWETLVAELQAWGAFGLRLLPDILAAVLGGQSVSAALSDYAGHHPAAGDPAPTDTLPEGDVNISDGKPYAVLKTVTYRDGGGHEEYTLTLKGTFVNLGGKPVLLRAEPSWNVVREERWRVSAGDVAKGEGEASCAFTVSRLFTGVAVKTETVTLTVRGLSAAQLPNGDLDGDGNLTAADARIALRIAVGLEQASAALRRRADVDLDGGVTAADARLILRAAVGLY